VERRPLPRKDQGRRSALHGRSDVLPSERKFLHLVRGRHWNGPVGSIPCFQDACWQRAVSAVFQLGFVAMPIDTAAKQRSPPAVNEPGEERFALPRIFRNCAGCLGHIGLEVRALDMTAAKRVNSTHTYSPSAKPCRIARRALSGILRPFQRRKCRSR
jgi:hypothetical protein